MSKLADFYQQAHKDSVLKAKLAELTQAYVAGVIGVAGKHGVSLTAADFAPASGALDDDALEAVAGGLGTTGIGSRSFGALVPPTTPNQKNG
jgi:hypothetical protein